MYEIVEDGMISEAVVTGSVLLLSAAGWLLLAIRRRWALVPAALAGVTGMGLVVLQPGDGFLTAAGWVWPPVMLALAGWIAVRTRLYPVVAALVLIAAGGLVGDVPRENRTPGHLYDVGGYRLNLDCAGSGSPTVLLVGGLGETSTAWRRVVPAVAATTRVCAYDRAGQGSSDDGPGPQDAVQVAADLHNLLARAGERGPYVLAGHSVGGPYAMTYAAHHPADVAGMVLLDSASPDQFTVLPDYAGFYRVLRGVTTILPTLARLGLGRLIGEPRDLRNQRDDVSRFPAAFRQSKALVTLGAKPLVVVTATEGMQAGWPVAQDRLAALSSQSRHIQAATTHAALLDDATGAAISARAIIEAVT